MGNDAPTKDPAQIRKELIERLGDPDVTESEIDRIKKKLDLLSDNT